MSTSKLKPFNDPRVTLRSAHLNGHTYGYIHANPTSTPHRGTIVLVHGFPDISFGWRNQIPFLASLGLEVIALDCLGYGRSDAPPSSHLSAYTCRRISNDIATLCQQLNLNSIILGGHDWGGMVVYRVALHHPNLIQAFFSICTPYTPPSPIHTPLQTVVQKSMPNFRYQIQFASGQVESAIQSPNEIRQFLNALYGGRTPAKKQAFSPEYGAFLDQVPTVSPSPLLSTDEMDYYVQEYARHGINGPLNWYRVREENYVEELESFFDNDPQSKKESMRIVDKEVLFVQAMKDGALKPFMARKMDERIERLTWEKVEAGHWVLWEKPEVVNGFIGRWLKEKVFGKSGGGANSKL